MTERLYYRDAYLREFTAQVADAVPDGPAFLIRLDRTAFYPTSGGQPHDTGTLDGFPVVDVFERDGHILHRLDAADRSPPPGGGTVVEGCIDWRRRFDLMQQHTGQHILSQAALRVLEAQTISVHFGSDRSTVDLGVALPTADQVADLEDHVNRVVLANVPVTVREIDEAEADHIGLRRPARRQGTIRVVEVEGFDRSACGGTHVRATGEIGAIALTRWERYKGGTRLEFLCGWRAVRDHRATTRVVRELAATLSVAEMELLDAVGRLAGHEREARAQAEDALSRLLATEAQARRRGIPTPGIVSEAIAGRPYEEVRRLAHALAAPGGLVVLLGSSDDGRLVFVRSPDVDVDVSALMRRAFEHFPGRGGGRADAAQGALESGTRVEDVLRAVRGWAEVALRA